tara:strand:- start:4244 stop:4375 length:132 start_codon:yes stop_codon:yes gene_type:complete
MSGEKKALRKQYSQQFRASPEYSFMSLGVPATSKAKQETLTVF